jgi:hypothetical protein
MRYRKMVGSKFPEITAIILGLIAIVFTTVGFEGDPVIAVSGCGTDNLGCVVTFALIVALITLIGLWMVIYLFALGLDSYSSRRARILQRIAEQEERARIEGELAKRMTLTAEPLHKDKLDLRIHNNEDAKIVVTRAFVIHEDRLGSKEVINWSRVSVLSEVPVQKGESITTRFLTEELMKTRFYITEHHDDGSTSTVPYSRGTHRFTVKIVYNSTEMREMGLIKSFDVVIKYSGSSIFDIDIKHAD